jgi:hypothetical protein
MPARRYTVNRGWTQSSERAEARDYCRRLTDSGLRHLASTGPGALSRMAAAELRRREKKKRASAGLV